MARKELSRIGLLNAFASNLLRRRTSYFPTPRALLGIFVVIILLSFWETSARLNWVESENWPPFSLIVRAFIHGVVSGELLVIMYQTLSLMLVGYICGSLIGIVMGICLGLSTPLNRFFSPLIETLRPIPISAIVPPLILFFGIGSELKIFVVAFTSFFPVLINTITGVRDIDKTLWQTGLTFRISPIARLWKIALPSALPSIFAGLRISLAFGLVAIVIAEMVAGSSGIGYFLIQTQYAMQPAPMYAAIVALSLVGYSLNRVIVVVERRILFWHGAG